jgi:hypothetical protein
MRHICFLCFNYPIVPVITVAEMITQDDRTDTIAIASSMLCSKVAKRIPVSTLMKLPISSRIVSKNVEWCIVRITLNVLVTS